MTLRSTIWVVSIALTAGCELLANLSGDRRFAAQPVRSAAGTGGLSSVDAAMDVSLGGAAPAVHVDAGAGARAISTDGGGGGRVVLVRDAGVGGAAAPEAGVPLDAAGVSRDAGPGTPGPSCAHMKGNECSGENCCRSSLVAGGTFLMGRSIMGTDALPGADPDETPEHAVTLNDFRLDEFEVTVGRFRRFFDAYDGTPPAENAGVNPRVHGSGWQEAWDVHLFTNRDLLRNALFCDTDATWTSEASVHETMPINCLTWYEAFAFCAWDGGRLPTEAEWEYAAAGGPQNRLYPWGSEVPTDDGGLAVLDCAGGGTPGSCERNDVRAVGTRRRGVGRYGQMDLAGSMSEFVLDWYDPEFYGRPEARRTNVVDLTPSNEINRVARGGAYDNTGYNARAAVRFTTAPAVRFEEVGVRCARDP